MEKFRIVFYQENSNHNNTKAASNSSFVFEQIANFNDVF